MSRDLSILLIPNRSNWMFAMPVSTRGPIGWPITRLYIEILELLLCKSLPLMWLQDVFQGTRRSF